MKISVSRILTCLMFLVVLMSTPTVWAQDAAPAAPAEQTASDQPSASGPVEAAELPAAAPQPSRPASGSTSSSASSPLSSAFSGGGLDLLKGLGAFILVLVVLYLFLKGLSRLGRFRGRGRDSFFELRGVQALDNHKYLAAVEVDGRIIVVGVTQDRITPVAQWIAEPDEDDIDLSAAKLPAEESGLQFKLPEEEDLPLDISVADHHSGRPPK